MAHKRIRKFNTKDTYPEQNLDNDLCQAVVAGNTIYLRGQVAQDLDTRENVAIGDPAGQAEKGTGDEGEPASHREGRDRGAPEDEGCGFDRDDSSQHRGQREEEDENVILEERRNGGRGPASRPGLGFRFRGRASW